jgi:hypothetical protein
VCRIVGEGLCTQRMILHLVKRFELKVYDLIAGQAAALLG